MIVRTYGRRSRFAGAGAAAGAPTTTSCPFSFPDDDDDDDLHFSQSHDFGGGGGGDDDDDLHLLSQPPSPPPPAPPSLLGFTAFSSQDSSPSPAPEKKRAARIAGRRRADEPPPAVAGAASAAAATATLMEAQEFGEMMESVDEVNFALDGLRPGQPRRVRRASMVALLGICGAAARRRILRAQGLAQRIIDAILTLHIDDTPCAIAAAGLFFVLATDVQDDHLLDSPSCIHFLLKLLNPPAETVESKALSIGSKLLGISKSQLLNGSNKDADSSSTEIILKVEEILLNCKELKSTDTDNEKTRPELCSKWIALLTMEKACLSAVSFEDTSEMVRRVGGNFKERLRELGGLDAIFDVMVTCHFALERFVKSALPSVLELKERAALQSVTLLLKCLKIMENATFLSKDNQIHLLKLNRKLSPQSSSFSFVGVVISAIELLSALSLLQNSSRSSSKRDSKSCEVPLMKKCFEIKDATLSSDLAGCKDSKTKSFSLEHKRRKCSSSKSEISYIDLETISSGSDVCASQKALDSEPVSCNGASSSSCRERHTNGGGLKVTMKKDGSKVHSIGSSNGWISIKAQSFERDSRDRVKRCRESENAQKDSSTGSFDPFAFDEGELEPSKWELLATKKETSQGHQTIETDREYLDDCELPLATANNASSQLVDKENHQSGESFSQSLLEEESSILEDCLLASVKVLMNLTNDNPVGCEQIASCGGLTTMASLITKHFPTFDFSLHKDNQIKGSVCSDQGADVGQDISSSENSKTLDANSKQLRDSELDFLVAILGLLVNLVEKDSLNRVRLASARVSVDQSGNSESEEIQRDVIPMLCSIFLANQGAGEAAGVISLDDEDSLLQGEREAEMMIVEAYAALLLAFLSTESIKVREAIASCLPNNSLKVLVPVLERFVAFHLSLNMISPETHSAVTKVIESCKGA